MAASGDWLRKVRPGEPFRMPAEAYNAFIDMVSGAADPDASGGKLAGVGMDTGTVLARNGTGAAVDLGGVIGLGDPVYSPTDNLSEFKFRPSLVGALPLVSTHIGRFGVAAEPIPSGKVGRVVVDGIAVAKVNVTDAAIMRADVKDSDRTQLQSSSAGNAEILWKESGTGTKWAIVRVGVSSDRFLARIDGSELISGASYRWRYAWTEVSLPAYGAATPDTFVAVSGGRSGTVSTNYALNAIESANTASFGGPGYKVLGDGLFKPIAIGKDVANTSYDVVVEMARDASGRYVFSVTNTVDGTCG